MKCIFTLEPCPYPGRACVKCPVTANLPKEQTVKEHDAYAVPGARP